MPPVSLSLKDGQLVPQGEDLELELGTGPEPVSYDHGQKSQGITHAPTLPRFGQTREFLRRMGFSEGTALIMTHRDGFPRLSASTRVA